MRPVAFIHTENVIPTKQREVNIIKEEIYREVDLVTYKYAEGRNALSTKEGNAVASDSSEHLDAAIIARKVSYRDAQLRMLIQYALTSEYQERADDVQNLEEVFRYSLKVPESFKDAMLQPLAEFIHRYLVCGTLYDWYAGLGSEQAAIYASELKEIEGEINGLLRTPSKQKRPLQPFGPAKRNIIL